jgi:hypothetical protein
MSYLYYFNFSGGNSSKVKKPLNLMYNFGKYKRIEVFGLYSLSEKISDSPNNVQMTEDMYDYLVKLKTLYIILFLILIFCSNLDELVLKCLVC